MAFQYEFEWDKSKAKTNFRKHGVSFEQATQVFRDPLALTVPDNQHSEIEVRWITLGKDVRGRYLVVAHTFQQTTAHMAQVRLISVRVPTRAEIESYEEGL